MNMTDEENKRYRAHIQSLLANSKDMVLKEISDEDLLNEIGRRLVTNRQAILSGVEALKGGTVNE